MKERRRAFERPSTSAKERHEAILFVLIALLSKVCFAVEPPAPPAPPPGLPEAQTKAWQHFTAIPAFKSIRAIQFDRSVLNSNPLTVQVDGTVYSINGKLSRLEGFPVRSASGAKGMSPGGTHWVGESADGFGSVSVMDDGEVDGDLTLRGRFFRVTGRDNIVLLVELDATRLREVRPSTPAVSGVPK